MLRGSDHRTRLLIAAFLALLGVLAALKMGRKVDNDLFWQLKDGERVVLERHLPVKEEYSFTAQGRPMVAIEWGGETVSYLVFRLGGYGALVCFNAALFVLVFAVLLALLRRRLPLLESLCLLSLAAFALLNFYAVRSQNWTFLFFTLFLYWAALWEDGSRWAPWAMAAAMLPWVNLHAGFMTGLAILGLICLRRAWETRRLAALGPLGLGTLLCCAHPNGVMSLVYPVWFMAAPPIGRGMILEWKPVDFTDKTSSPYLIILALFCWLGLFRLGGRFPWVFLALVLLALALRGRKLLPEFSMAALAAISMKLPISPRKHARLALIAGALLALSVTGRVILSRPWPRPFGDWERGYPQAAAELIASRYPGQRIFHDYDWGGYLIYKLYPRSQVFIDGRLDPYWSLLCGDYMALIEARPGWRKLLDDYGITVALLRPSGLLYGKLSRDPSWQTVHEDERSVLLTRR